jgi:hypothetical protein
VIVATLSSGVKVISKPSALAVPPWQMVSAKLGGVDLRVASWWAAPAIYSTDEGQTPTCWAPGLGTPGAVDIATSGEWSGTGIGLEGGDGPIFNHSKIGISTNAKTPLCIFGDMNQQGALAPDYAHPNQACSSSQNGRGGTFYVVSNAALWTSLTALLKGASAPIKANDGSTVGGSGANAPTKRSPKASVRKKTSPKASGAKKTASKTPRRKTAKKAPAAKRRAPARKSARKSSRRS